MTARSVRSFTLACTALLATTVPGQAQTVIIDEGSFRLSVRGTAVGTETFAIRRSGDGAGATTTAQGRIVLDSGRQTRSLLQFEGPDLRPTAYQIEVTGPETQSITGQAAGNRFRATITSTAGEQMREYLTSDGAVVLDEGVAHQHYFLMAATDGDGRVAVIVPRQSRQVTATVTDAGRERITIAGRATEARRIEIQPQGLPNRVIWVDDADRVLRFRIPTEEYLAERTSLP